MNKAILFLILFILLFVLLFSLNPKNPIDPLIRPLDYKEEVLNNYRGFYK